MTGRRRLLLGAVLATIAVVGGVLYWFQPQKLVIDERVDESSPVTIEAASGPGTSAAVPARGGEFVSLDHRTVGTARVLDVEGGSRVVRLEGFETDNGPDLFVYLSTNPPDGNEAAFDDDVVNLGRLKGNKGDQNYDVPADVDLDRFASVVIWCDRFNAAFGAAPLG